MASKVYGAILILISLGVFLIRFQHAGTYSMPTIGPLLGAIACFALGLLLFWSARPKWFGWLAIALSPIAIFPALYSIMGETEEVISIFANNSEGVETDLRLWVVDREDGAWVGMGRTKAVEHGLDGSQLQMLRSGDMSCVIPRLHEDRPTVKEIHGMKVDKYKVAQISGAMGLYPLEAPETTVVLRLDSCSS